MFCDDKHVDVFYCLVQEMATETDPKWRDLDDGKYDVSRKASLPVLKEGRLKNAELDLHFGFKNAFRINSELIDNFIENGTWKTAS